MSELTDTSMHAHGYVDVDQGFPTGVPRYTKVLRAGARGADAPIVTIS